MWGGRRVGETHHAARVVGRDGGLHPPYGAGVNPGLRDAM